MSGHQSPLPSPHYQIRPQSFHAINGVPVMPFSPIVPPSSASAMTFSGNTLVDPLQRAIPNVGSAAPHFTAKAIVQDRFKDIEFIQFTRNNEWLMLMFFPMAWSYVCPTEIRAFDRHIKEFEKRNCTVLFCSTDSEYVLRAWNQTSEAEGGLGRVHIPLITDRSHDIAKQYGVLIEEQGVAQRAMFIINPRGVIKQITTNDVNIGRSVDEAKRLLDALQFADKFGEGCPVDWRRGDRGLSIDSGSGSGSGRDSKRGSSSAASAISPPQSSSKAPRSSRPKQVRMNTWSGNLGRFSRRLGSGDVSTLSQSQISAPDPSNNQLIRGMGVIPQSQRAGSVPVTGNWSTFNPSGASSHIEGLKPEEARKMLIATQGHERVPQTDDGSKASTPQSPSGKMNNMGGYFDSVVSPLDQPQTLLNAMMSTAH